MVFLSTAEWQAGFRQQSIAAEPVLPMAVGQWKGAKSGGQTGDAELEMDPAGCCRAAFFPDSSAVPEVCEGSGSHSGPRDVAIGFSLICPGHYANVLHFPHLSSLVLPTRSLSGACVQPAHPEWVPNLACGVAAIC